MSGGELNKLLLSFGENMRGWVGGAGGEITSGAIGVAAEGAEFGRGIGCKAGLAMIVDGMVRSRTDLKRQVRALARSGIGCWLGL